MMKLEQFMYEMEEAGFDLTMAMEICVGEPSLYLEVIRTGLDEGRRKISLLQDCLACENYDRYLVEVHGLKNAAKAIGAALLSDMARIQEEDIREGRIRDKSKESRALIEEYERVLDLMEKALLVS